MENVFEKGNKERINPARKVFVRGLMMIQIIMSAVLNAKLTELDLLPKKYDILLVVALVCLNIILWYSVKKLSIAVLMSFTSLVVTAVLVVATISIFKIDTTISSVISDKDYEIVQLAAVVPVDSEISDINEFSGRSVGFLKEEKYINSIKKEIEKEVSDEPEYTEYEDAIKLTKNLLDDKEDIIIINQGHLDMVKDIEGYEDLDQRVKVIHTFDIKIKKQNTSKSKDITKDTIVVYISASDSREGMIVTSRSDVNILAVINAKERKLQLINTPRDYYVEIAGTGGHKDKLTHAGVKGIETSIKTLEELYDVDVDYYFKINFTGFKTIIDKVGGVDVYSEQEFKAITGHCFDKGINHLDGTEALAFARERHALKGGDDQRGKNQMAVIKALTDKMTSKEVLKNYNDILKSMSGCVDMDIPTEAIYSVVNMQLEDNKKWEISTTSVAGTGLKTTTYMSSTPIWVTEPDMATVEEAKRCIQDCMNE